MLFYVCSLLKNARAAHTSADFYPSYPYADVNYAVTSGYYLWDCGRPVPAVCLLYGPYLEHVNWVSIVAHSVIIYDNVR